MIFSLSRSELISYYGNSCTAEKIDFLLRCHEKIGKSMAGTLHLTTSLPAISRSKQMLSSAGGLGGCVYGVPIYMTGEVHGLGSYLLYDELPMFLERQNREAAICALGLYPTNVNVGCVDYLLFGEQYARIYHTNPGLEQSISKVAADRIYDTQLDIAVRLLSMLESSTPITEKIAHCKKAFGGSTILRALYFEIILEYVFLFQDDAEASGAASRDELYNPHAKNLIFRLNPSLATHFSLANFECTPAAISNYLKRQSIAGRVIKQYDKRHFYAFLLQRLRFYVAHYLVQNNQNLYGQVLFRYFGERAFFEAATAKVLWQEAQDKGINVLTYRMPKGEVGLLPTAKSVKIFTGEIKESLFIKDDQINARLHRLLVSQSKQSVMRNPYEQSPEGTSREDSGVRMIGFVRHGESIANREGRFGGRDDSPLTETGAEQAAAIGSQLIALAFKPRRVVTSSLSRARRTAAIIAPILGIDPAAIIVDARFDEYDFGSYNGKPKQGVGSEEFMAIPDREDPQHFYARVRDGWNEYQGQDGNTLVVSHAFVRHMIDCALDGGDVSRFHDYASRESTARLSFYEPKPI